MIESKEKKKRKESENIRKDFLWLTHETSDPLFLFHPLVARRDLMKTVIEAGAQGPIDRQESRGGCLAANHRPPSKGPTLFSYLPSIHELTLHETRLFNFYPFRINRSLMCIMKDLFSFLFLAG